MLSFTVDPRNNGTSSTSAACCCPTATLKPGDSNLMRINYAPWSLPFGGEGIVQTPKITVEALSSTCDTSFIANKVMKITTALSTANTFDLDAAVTTGAATKAKHIPLYGPNHGTVTAPDANKSVTYTPTTGYNGFDYALFELEDASARKELVLYAFTVGTPEAGTALDPHLTSELPYVVVGDVVVNSQVQCTQFQVSMPPSVESCERFRLTVRQPARDCAGNVFYHTSCYDLSPGNC